jgi:hypothetical protein
MKKMVGICKTVDEEDGPNELNLMAGIMRKIAGMRSSEEDNRNEIS